MIGLGLALAAVAATLNATGDLFQRSSARDEGGGLRGSVSLLGRLVRKPRWLAGVLVSLVGLVVHVGALAFGEVGAVQPILVGELPLAVLGSAVLFGRRLSTRDVLAVGALALGLALFVFFLSPSGGARLLVPGTVWATGVGAVGAIVLLLAAAGWQAGSDLRAALLSTASGVGYGLTGVFFAVVGRVLRVEGITAALASWQSWAALIAGGASFYLLQNALAAGKLLAVEPGLTLANPLVAVTWSILIFGEHPRTGPALIGSVTGGVLIVAGTVILSRSPVLESHGQADAAAPAANRSVPR